MQKVIIMNYICLWGILASITGIAIMFSVIKHKKSVSAIKNGTYLCLDVLDNSYKSSNHFHTGITSIFLSFTTISSSNS